MVNGTSVPATTAAAGAPCSALTTVSCFSTLSPNFWEWPRAMTVPVSSVTVMKSEPAFFISTTEILRVASWFFSATAVIKSSSSAISAALCINFSVVVSLAVLMTCCIRRMPLFSSSSIGTFIKWIATKSTILQQVISAPKSEPTYVCARVQRMPFSLPEQHPPKITTL